MIEVERQSDGVVVVRMARPERRNALDVAGYRAFADALRAAGADSAARAVVIASSGHVFCAGNDLKGFETDWPQPEDGPVLGFLRALAGLDIPVVAAVQGPAVGVGATMLLHVDIVIADTAAVLRYPFVDLGIAPEAASSALLPARLGRARAMEIVLTGRPVAAAEALDLGLVSRIAEADAFPEAMAIAREIAAKSPEAVRATKRLMTKCHGIDVAALMAEEICVINALIEGARRTV